MKRAAVHHAEQNPYEHALFNVFRFKRTKFSHQIIYNLQLLLLAVMMTDIISEIQTTTSSPTMSMIYYEYLQGILSDALEQGLSMEEVKVVSYHARNPPSSFRIRKQCMKQRPLPSDSSLPRRRGPDRHPFEQAWGDIECNVSNSDLIMKPWSEDRICNKQEKLASERWVCECPLDKAPLSPIRRSRKSFDEADFQQSGKFIGT